MEECLLISEFELTVGDVLTRDLFKNAKVVAGETGLKRQIKWTHILETEAFDSLINGSELILTTGINLELDNCATTTYERLLQKDVAGICIEKGPYFKTISTDIKRFADKHAFPIIIFEEVVRFVDITQDLHSLLINQHHQMLNQLSTLTHKFNELSLAPNGILKILQALHHYFGQHSLCLLEDSKSYYYPPESKIDQENILSYISTKLTNKRQSGIISIYNETFAIAPVFGLGQIWGYLCLNITKNLNEEFLLSVLDRASLAIAQILLRNRTIEERKLNSEDECVRTLLQGKPYNQSDLHTFLPVASTNLYFRVFIIKTESPDSVIGEDNWEEIKIQRTILIRSLFKHAGYFPAVSVRKDEIAIICSFIAETHVNKSTKQFLQVTKNLLSATLLNNKITYIGISGLHQNVSHISKGYAEANDVIYLNKQQLSTTYFHDEIGIYQILLPLQKDKQLQLFINDYIGELIFLDENSDSELLKTLEVYLACRGSKKEAAEKLFIVRQTLYHRLRKIEQYIGKDFMDPVKRLAIETAIKAYYILKNRHYLDNK